MAAAVVANRWEISRKELGAGGFGTVFRGRDIKEDLECAAKKTDLADRVNKEAFEAEVDILKAVQGHESIIGLLGDAKEGQDGWLMLELAGGGELFDLLEEYKRLTERQAWPYISALVRAVRHCHSRGVVHRDLKLENVLLVADDPTAIRLIDFGLAIQLKLTESGEIDPKERRSESAGTQAYRAPEMDGGAYEPAKVDVWAIGIILFSLCSGFFPLLEASTSDFRFRKLLQAQNAGKGACEALFAMYKRPCPFGDEMKAMLDGMLTIDPAKRFGLAEVAAAPWLQQAPAPPPSALGGDDDGDDPVYRSLGGLDLDGEGDAELELPEDAVPIARQAARLERMAATAEP